MSLRITKIGPHRSNGHTVYHVEANHFDELKPLFEILNVDGIQTNPSIKFLKKHHLRQFHFTSNDGTDELLNRIMTIIKLTL